MMVRDRDDDGPLPSPTAVAHDVAEAIEGQMVEARDERALADRQALIGQSVRHRARLVRLIALDSSDEQDEEAQRLAARLNTSRASCIVLDAIPALLGTDETTFAVRFDDDGEESQVYRSELAIGDELSPDEWRAVQVARANAGDRSG